MPPQGTYALHDLAGAGLEPYLRKGCRWAAVSYGGPGCALPTDFPPVVRSLERYPVVWESSADGQSRTGPTIRIFRLDAAPSP